MKKAKNVEIPLDRPLTYDEYKKLRKHAINSAIWNATHYNRNTFQIRDKLITKGYTTENVTFINKDGDQEDANIIDDTISHLINNSIIDDERLADDYVYNSAMAGKSISSIRTKMFQKMFPKEIIDNSIDKFLEEYDDTDSDALIRVAEKIVRVNSFKKLDQYKKKNKLIRMLVSKGFSFNEILDWINEHPEEMS